ncbi:MAG: FtsQ-type POTRA domain-containing protein [Patescibacteria group bacterium]
MSVPIRSRQAHHDPIARAHHRAGIVRATSVAVIALVVLGALGWVFFFSSVFAVTDIRVSGAQSIGDERVHTVVRELLDRRTLLMFQPARNIILLDTEAVSASVKSNYDTMRSVVVRKQYPHTLEVIVTERVAFGLWCRDDECKYFDRDGARWGSAVPSRGPLLVRVQDGRTDSDVPERLVRGMLAAIDGLPELGLRGLSVTLPDSAPGDMRIAVDKKYDLLLDAYGDMTDQLATLGVLLSDKANPPAGGPAWAPAYIDLRTPGRAYYPANRGAIDK